MYPTNSDAQFSRTGWSANPSCNAAVRLVVRQIAVFAVTSSMLVSGVYAQAVPATTAQQPAQSAVATSVAKVNPWDFIDAKRDLKKDPLTVEEIKKLDAMEVASVEGLPDGELSEENLKKVLTGKKLSFTKTFSGGVTDDIYYFMPTGKLVAVANGLFISQGEWKVKMSERRAGRALLNMDLRGVGNAWSLPNVDHLTQLRDRKVSMETWDGTKYLSKN